MSTMSTHHVLIIDDNSNNAEVLQGLLSEQGIPSIAILDPARIEAELPNLQQVDIVFCDLEMPKIDGFRLLPKLRQTFGKSVPIITYSVHLSEIDKARRLGFDGFLGKPVDADRFPLLLRRILNGQAIWELP